MPRRSLPAFAGLLCCVLPFAAFAGVDYAKLERVSAQMDAPKAAALDDLLQGRPDDAIARLEKAAGNDWMARFVLANTTWTMFPDQSLAWQRDAYDRSGRQPLVLVELALHYTRQERCEEALAAWKQIDRAGLYKTYFPMLGAYCHLKLGHDREAFADIDRAQVDSHSPLGGVLVELWGARPPEVVHSYALAEFRATPDAAHLSRALKVLTTFSMSDTGMQAADALAAAVADSPLRDDGAARGLACLRPAFAAERKRAQEMARREAAYDFSDMAPNGPAWKQAFADCRLLVGADSLPADSVMVRLLMVWALESEAIDPAQLLAWHGKALDARARSEPGDFEALEVLAALQSTTKETAALRASDEYGWSRYKSAKYAASRFLGQMIEEDETTPVSIALIDRAHAEFPDDPTVLSLWLKYGTVPAAQATAEWRKLALAEFHAPSGSNAMHPGYGPSLANLGNALREYRKRALPGEARTASTEP